MSKRERVAADLDHPNVLRRIERVGRKRELRGGAVNHPELAGALGGRDQQCGLGRLGQPLDALRERCP
jgi:hypothetical protein